MDWDYLHSVKGKGKCKVVPVLNYAPRREDVLGKWRYSYMNSWTRQEMEVSGQIHAPAVLPPGKEPQVPTG
jgi:hypothetical protein